MEGSPTDTHLKIIPGRITCVSIHTTIRLEEIVNRFKAALVFTIVLTAAGCGKKGDESAMNNSGSASDTATVSTNAGTDTGTAPPPAPVPAAPTMSDENIFAKMGMTDSLEIVAAKLALTKTKSADVKEFANMMIKEHGKMKSEGAALASRLGITPAPMPDDPSASQMGAMMQQLQSAPDDKTFDRSYVDQMVISHQQTLDFLTAASSAAKNDSLRVFIEKGRPVVQMHLTHAQGMTGKVGAPVSQ